MLKIRRSPDRLIFNMEMPILVRQHLYIDTAPGLSTIKVNPLGPGRSGHSHFECLTLKYVVVTDVLSAFCKIVIM